MTDKTDPPANESGAPKRPHATLDLKATEVKADAAKAASQADTAKASTKPEQAAPGTAKADVPKADQPKSGEMKAADMPSKETAAKPAPQKPSAAPAAARQGSFIGRAFSHLVAGIVGGGVVLFGGDWATDRLQQAGVAVPPTPFARVTADLDRRLRTIEGGDQARSVEAELSAKIAAQDERLVALDGLARDVAALRDEQLQTAIATKALSAKVEQPAADPGAAERIAKLESQLALIASAAKSETGGGPIAQVAALAGKIADLESTVATQIGALRLSIPQNVDQRLDKIVETSETAKSGTQRVDRDLTALKTEIARLTQSLETLKSDSERLQKSVLAAQEETGRVSSGLGEMKGLMETQAKAFAKPDDVAAAVAPVTGKLAEIEKNIATVLTREEDRQTNAERIVMSLELANLRRAIDRGDSYTVELEAAKAAAGDRVDLSALEAFKSQGTPGLAELQEQRRAVFNAMLDAAENPSDGSVVDQLLASAKSVVRVRKTTVEEGDTGPEATIARAEAALLAGKLGESLAIMKALPPAALTAGAAWLKQLEAREAIDRAIAGIESQLKTALVAPASSEAGQPKPQ